MSVLSAAANSTLVSRVVATTCKTEAFKRVRQSPQPAMLDSDAVLAVSWHGQATSECTQRGSCGQGRQLCAPHRCCRPLCSYAKQCYYRAHPLAPDMRMYIWQTTLTGSLATLTWGGTLAVSAVTSMLVNSPSSNIRIT